MREFAVSTRGSMDKIILVSIKCELAKNRIVVVAVVVVVVLFATKPIKEKRMRWEDGKETVLRHQTKVTFISHAHDN